MDPDLWSEQTVREKLNNGDYIIVIHTKDFSPKWSDLRLIADSNDPVKSLVRWILCRFCCAAFQTHSEIDEKENCNNHGLTPCTKHLEHCHAKKEETKRILHLIHVPLIPNNQFHNFLLPRRK